MTGLVPADGNLSQLVAGKFEEKRAIAWKRHRNLFHVFDGPLTEEERFAMMFLYAYMPLNDLADYDGELFLKHVRDTLRIRRTVPWGSKISDEHFLYFVLPYRVNNENVEDHRDWFFEEIYERVRSLSMEEAVLEVNHWCHEKATYTGNDPRTVSPRTLIRTALGRCGEQSTLAVAALRSLCIPARQVYTPRWAHCDSNHAWVEAWVDGKWGFFGACEPEPRMNQGWFVDPARRGMLMNTRIPANYSGPEEITFADTWHTEINLLANYAPTRRVSVRVEDAEGRPVAGADVHLQVYNYAELSPLAKLRTGEDGIALLTTGFGDLFVEAARDGRWAFGFIQASDAATVILKLGDGPMAGTVDFDFHPPAAALGEDVEPTPAEREENNRRLKEEDQLRAAYEATFVQEPEASQLAEELGLPGDRVWNVLRKARGNSKEIAAFLREETPAFGGWALRLLEVIHEKDLTDTFRPTLKEHLHGAMEVKGDTEDSIFASYVLNPRVLLEMLRPYRTFFRNAFYDVTSPYELADRIRNDIKIMQGYTYYQGSATPRGSLELGAGDRISRDILFVAAARSLGMPSRLEPGDRRPQYREDGRWHDAFPEMQSGASGAKPASGRITLTGPVPEGEKAEYFLHYTLARHEEGMFRTFQYRFGADGLIGETLDVLPGTYRLTTGRRLTDGSVLIRLHTFKVGPGDSASVEVVLREEMQQPDAAYGELGDEAARWLAGSGTLSQWLNGKGAVLAWVEPDREPTKHLIRELRERKSEFDGWGGRIALFAGDDKVNVPLGEHPWPDMPERAVFSSDAVYEGWNAVSAGLNDQLPMQFPIVLLVDPSGTVRYASAGYKLGRGEDLLRVISQF